MFHGLPVAPCSHWFLWMLGSQWFLKLLVVPCSFLWLFRCLWLLGSWFPVVPQGPRVTCGSLWFPGFPPGNLWFLMLPVAYGSSGSSGS